MSAEATTFFLVRHAAHDRQGRVLVGRQEGVRLGPESVAQAARLAARLARERVAAVYASPLERCRATAAPVAAAHGLPVREDAALTEIDLGAWTGLTFEALRPDPDWQRWNEHRASAKPPGGEGMAEVADRVLPALARWRDAHPGQGVVAVSHADVIKAALCRVLGLSFDRHDAFEIAPASVSAVVLWAGGGKVLFLNEAVA